jgi:hypothetical protein
MQNGVDWIWFRETLVSGSCDKGGLECAEFLEEMGI